MRLHTLIAFALSAVLATSALPVAKENGWTPPDTRDVDARGVNPPPYRRNVETYNPGDYRREAVEARVPYNTGDYRREDIEAREPIRTGDYRREEIEAREPQIRTGDYRREGIEAREPIRTGDYRREIEAREPIRTGDY